MAAKAFRTLDDWVSQLPAEIATQIDPGITTSLPSLSSVTPSVYVSASDPASTSKLASKSLNIKASLPLSSSSMPAGPNSAAIPVLSTLRWPPSISLRELFTRYPVLPRKLSLAPGRRHHAFLQGVHPVALSMLYLLYDFRKVSVEGSTSGDILGRALATHLHRQKQKASSEALYSDSISQPYTQFDRGNE